MHIEQNTIPSKSYVYIYLLIQFSFNVGNGTEVIFKIKSNEESEENILGGSTLFKDCF